MVRVERLLDQPIIGPGLDPSIGENIQGPSLIRVPDWLPSPLGRYYLYFADHKGKYIRLAHADELTGPWRVHVPGSLQLEDSHFPTEPPPLSEERWAEIQESAARLGLRILHDLRTEVTEPHMASPDVHVDDADRRIRMYFHGLEDAGRQVSRVALSRDGVRFDARPEIFGPTYMRVFLWRGAHYVLSMPGRFLRSQDGLTGFESGPLLFSPDMRHAAVCLRDETLFVFWTQVGEAPERILLSTIDLRPDWLEWRESDPVEVLRPERCWEGAEAPLEPSVRSTAYGRVNQLRDPAVYVEGDRTFLLYAVAGESGIGLAEVHFG